MKISRLSRLSGVSIPTIKFYVREQLLPAGIPTARNQAEYDTTHLTRLRLIRLLTGAGMMSLASVREVLAAVDSDQLPPPELVRVVNRALLAEHAGPPADREAYDSVAPGVDRMLQRLGWRVGRSGPERESLIQALAALRALGVPCVAEELAPYAEVAEKLATQSLDRATGSGDAVLLVARIVLFDVAFDIMRRMALQHRLAEVLGEPADPPQ
ncbi:MerR family transcriptional regulator [Catellatospora methionotrophica]|uniref:MerR family transcriptional regulator n=1 Tax=Catellatospora methionotrophica TaxID=121620 RepID=UPI0023B2499B|nr:MerR family transcriptional regulator [Catellatospora methionotrophica]